MTARTQVLLESSVHVPEAVTSGMARLLYPSPCPIKCRPPRGMVSLAADPSPDADSRTANTISGSKLLVDTGCKVSTVSI